MSGVILRTTKEGGKIGGKIGGPAGFLIGLATGLCIGGMLFLWKHKKDNERQTKTQEIIIELEKRLRKVESELADAKDLSKKYIEILKKERDNLKSELKQKKAA